MGHFSARPPLPPPPPPPNHARRGAEPPQSNGGSLAIEACKVFITLIQPSSAAAERVFSLLASSFNNNQESALEDYIQTSVMLQYNHR